MRKPSAYRRVRDVLKRLTRFLKREPPEDPYAYVGAPRKPKLPGRSAAAAEPLE